MNFRACILLALMPSATVAEGFRCEDAVSFYNYAMFTAEAVGAVTGSCGDQIAQPACRALLDALADNEEEISKANLGSSGDFLQYLAAECPEHFPENPGEF